MNKRIAAVMLMSAMTVMPVCAQRPVFSQSSENALRKLNIAEMAISNLYVDSVNENKLVEDGIRGMIEKLDPHSSYTTAKETKQMDEPLKGSFEGIGVQFNMDQDTLLVIQNFIIDNLVIEEDRPEEDTIEERE